MKRLLISIMVLGPLYLSAQQYISFTYDAAGNRVRRELVVGAFRKEAADTLADRLGETRFHIHPNPTSATVQVEIDRGDQPQTEREYTLMNLAGTVLARRTSSVPIQDFDLSTQPPGLYLLRIRQKDEEVVWRIVRE